MKRGQKAAAEGSSGEQRGVWFLRQEILYHFDAERVSSREQEERVRSGGTVGLEGAF